MTKMLLGSGGYRILSDKITELYLLFYSHILHYFVRLNLFLQHEEPVIVVVYEQVCINIQVAIAIRM